MFIAGLKRNSKTTESSVQKKVSSDDEMSFPIREYGQKFCDDMWVTVGDERPLVLHSQELGCWVWNRTFEH
jgi:hypothetical protein